MFTPAQKEIKYRIGDFIFHQHIDMSFNGLYNNYQVTLNFYF